jgi:hypothetical protein
MYAHYVLSPFSKGHIKNFCIGIFIKLFFGSLYNEVFNIRMVIGLTNIGIIHILYDVGRIGHTNSIYSQFIYVDMVLFWICI